MSTVPTRLSLEDAQSYLNTAEDALNGWHARQSTTSHSYVRDGHETIRFIDETARELHAVRAALIGELRADEIDRAARVDAMLAQLAAERGGERYEREQPPGGPLPPEVGGWSIGRGDEVGDR